MPNFRNPKYLERYEDIVFALDTALVTNVTNNAHQKNKGYRFVIHNSGEMTPFDRYNARFSVNFERNSSHSLIQKLDVKMNGRQVYDCNNANHIVNIKNFLEYSPAYVSSTATNEFYYHDTSRHAEHTSRTSELQKGFCCKKSTAWFIRFYKTIGS